MQINTHFSRFEREHVLREMSEKIERMAEHAREEKRVLRASDDPVDFERIARMDRQQQTIAHRTKVIESLEADLKQAGLMLNNASDRLSAFNSEILMKVNSLQALDVTGAVGKIRDLMSGLVGAINARRADGSYLFAGSGAPISDTSAPGTVPANYTLSPTTQTPAPIEIGDGLHHTSTSQVWQGMPDLLNKLAAAATALTNASDASEVAAAVADLRNLIDPVDLQVKQVETVKDVNNRSAKRLEGVRTGHELEAGVLVKARLAIEGKPGDEALTELMTLYRAISSARTVHAEVGKLSFFDVV
jgi:flagellar hook-associated protein 3 FlgL